jgi:hypothetical protein
MTIYYSIVTVFLHMILMHVIIIMWKEFTNSEAQTLGLCLQTLVILKAAQHYKLQNFNCDNFSFLIQMKILPLLSRHPHPFSNLHRVKISKIWCFQWLLGMFVRADPFLLFFWSGTVFNQMSIEG